MKLNILKKIKVINVVNTPLTMPPKQRKVKKELPPLPESLVAGPPSCWSESFISFFGDKKSSEITAESVGDFIKSLKLPNTHKAFIFLAKRYYCQLKIECQIPGKKKEIYSADYGSDFTLVEWDEEKHAKNFKVFTFQMRSLTDERQWSNFIDAVLSCLTIQSNFEFWSPFLNRSLSLEKKQVILTVLLVRNRLSCSEDLPYLPLEMWFNKIDVENEELKHEMGILNYLALLWIGKYQKPPRQEF